MKIALLSMYSGHIDRGVESWVREFSKRMCKTHDTLVFQGSDEKLDRIYKSKVIRVKILWKIRAGENFLAQLLSFPYWESLNLSFTLRCLPHLIRYKPDIVMPGNGGAQTFIVKLVSLVFGWKMVVVGHAGLGAPDKWNLLMRPDLYISPSKRGVIWARSLTISKGLKITNIPHGVDLKNFSPRGKTKQVILKKPIVLCVASFDPYKRVDLTIRAVAETSNLSLLVISGDRNSGKIDKLGKELLRKRYLKIRVKPEDMPSYYRAADAFTLASSEQEAFGIVYLEALATNLPIVATKDALRDEIAGKAGILVDPEDTRAYAQALETALNKKWDNIPREQAMKFSWDKIVAKYATALENLNK
jgi:glycosyltransferase involved in cell wall biosynthesis